MGGLPLRAVCLLLVLACEAHLRMLPDQLGPIFRKLVPSPRHLEELVPLRPWLGLIGHSTALIGMLPVLRRFPHSCLLGSLREAPV